MSRVATLIQPSFQKASNSVYKTVELAYKVLHYSNNFTKKKYFPKKVIATDIIGFREKAFGFVVFFPLFKRVCGRERERHIHLAFLFFSFPFLFFCSM